MTTVCASGVRSETTRRYGSTDVARLRGSKMARYVNATSADVSGTPSAKRASGRRWYVIRVPSGGYVTVAPRRYARHENRNVPILRRESDERLAEERVERDDLLVDRDERDERRGVAGVGDPQDVRRSAGAAAPRVHAASSAIKDAAASDGSAALGMSYSRSDFFTPSAYLEPPAAEGRSCTCADYSTGRRRRFAC